MEKKYRLYNDRNSDIGVKLHNGIERNVKANGGWIPLERDDIEWLFASCPKILVGHKRLRLDDKELAIELGIIDEDTKPLNEKEIKTQLSKSAKALKEWLDENKEPHILDEVYKVAMEMDLPSSKLKLLNEYMPRKEFIKGKTEDDIHIIQVDPKDVPNPNEDNK